MFKAPIFTLIAAACALAACGQKGDLFLPGDDAGAGRVTLPRSIAPGATAADINPTAPPNDVEPAQQRAR